MLKEITEDSMIKFAGETTGVDVYCWMFTACFFRNRSFAKLEPWLWNILRDTENSRYFAINDSIIVSSSVLSVSDCIFNCYFLQNTFRRFYA